MHSKLSVSFDIAGFSLNFSMRDGKGKTLYVFLSNSSVYQRTVTKKIWAMLLCSCTSFDVLSFDILSNKIHHNGLECIVKPWFNSYLQYNIIHTCDEESLYEKKRYKSSTSRFGSLPFICHISISGANCICLFTRLWLIRKLPRMISQILLLMFKVPKMLINRSS